MKKFNILIIIVLVSLLTHKYSNSQTSIRANYYALYYLDNINNNLIIGGKHKFAPKMGLTNYVLISKSWSEALTGVDFYLTKSLTIGILGGIQTNKEQEWRLASHVVFTKNKFLAVGTFEWDNWVRERYTVVPMFVFQYFSIGAYLEKFTTIYDAGPYWEIPIGKTPFKIWGDFLWDFTNNEFASMLGFSVSFRNPNPTFKIPDE